MTLTMVLFLTHIASWAFVRCMALGRFSVAKDGWLGHPIGGTYTPLGNSMRLHELLRLVGGKKTVEVGACCVQLVFRKTFLLVIVTASCLFACLEFTYCVSTIGN